MTFFNHFCGRIPRDGACVVGRHRSEGFVREPLKISNICPSIIFVGRTHATDTESAKTDRKFKYERSSETYIGFSDDLFVSIIFVDRVHATALVLPTNFVAWASPASHLRFQTTCDRRFQPPRAPALRRSDRFHPLPPHHRIQAGIRRSRRHPRYAAPFGKP